MTITHHKRRGPFSQRAFTCITTGPFCGAPAYGRESFPFAFPELVTVCEEGLRSDAPILRYTLWSSLTRSRSCFYPKERCTLEPAET